MIEKTGKRYKGTSVKERGQGDVEGIKKRQKRKEDERKAKASARGHLL